MTWKKGKNWWLAAGRLWLLLIAIRVGTGDLWNSYHESWSAFLRWFWVAALVSILVTALKGLWRLWKKRQPPEAPSPQVSHWNAELRARRRAEKNRQSAHSGADRAPIAPPD